MGLVTKGRSTIATVPAATFLSRAVVREDNGLGRKPTLAGGLISKQGQTQPMSFLTKYWSQTHNHASLHAFSSIVVHSSYTHVYSYEA